MAKPIRNREDVASLDMSSGDVCWVLVSAALVLLMVFGLALFYGGMVRRKCWACRGGTSRGPRLRATDRGRPRGNGLGSRPPRPPGVPAPSSRHRAGRPVSRLGLQLGLLRRLFSSFAERGRELPKVSPRASRESENPSQQPRVALTRRSPGELPEAPRSTRGPANPSKISAKRRNPRGKHLEGSVNCDRS